MVILDATALLLLLDEKTSPPMYPGTKQLMADAHDRIVVAVTEVRKRGDKILIAAPVLAEVLVRARDAGPGYVKTFNESAHFKPVPFDQLAAITHAGITRAAVDSGDKRDGVDDSLAKIKFDRQIVAIAKAEGADTLYTDDDRLAVHAQKQGINVIRTHEIALNLQTTLFDQVVEPEPPPPEAEESAEERVSLSPESLPEPEVVMEAATRSDSGAPAPPIEAIPTVDTTEKTKGEAVIETAPPPSLMPDSPA